MKKIGIFVIFCLLFTGCTKEKSKKEPKKESNNEVSFVAVGDNLVHERVYQVADLQDGKEDGVYDFLPNYKNIQSYIKNADLSYINQETLIGGDDLGISGYPSFNTPEQMAEVLHTLGFDIVNGASNHTLDKGYQAIKNSIDIFDQYPDITYVGVNNSKEMQETIPVIKKNGIRFAILSYNEFNNNTNMPNDYCINMFDKEKIIQDVENAKEISDVILVSAHWGKEYSFEPTEFQKEYAQLFADLGVDIVIGTHSHTIQPVEWIEGEEGNKTLVAYSLGNFVHGMLEEETQLGGMLKLNFVKDKDSNDVEIKNVVFVPLVNYYTGNPNNIMETRDNFSVYPLKDFTEKLASSHGLNGYEGITITIDKLKQKVEDVIQGKVDVDF